MNLSRRIGLLDPSNSISPYLLIDPLKAFDDFKNKQQKYVK